VLTTLSHQLLEDILQQVRPLIGRGKVANYIPALAETPANRNQAAIAPYRVKPVNTELIIVMRLGNNSAFLLRDRPQGYQHLAFSSRILLLL